MILHEPFKISARLGPALQIGDGWLTLLTIKQDDDRQHAAFVLDTPEFVHVDQGLQSGYGGFRGLVAPFESFLGFMEAAAEAYSYGPDSDCYAIFPLHVMEWAHENSNEISMLGAVLRTEDGDVNESLIDAGLHYER